MRTLSGIYKPWRQCGTGQMSPWRGRGIKKVPKSVYVVYGCRAQNRSDPSVIEKIFFKTYFQEYYAIRNRQCFYTTFSAAFFCVLKTVFADFWHISYEMSGPYKSKWGHMVFPQKRWTSYKSALKCLIQKEVIFKLYNKCWTFAEITIFYAEIFRE